MLPQYPHTIFCRGCWEWARCRLASGGVCGSDIKFGLKTSTLLSAFTMAQRCGINLSHRFSVQQSRPPRKLLLMISVNEPPKNIVNSVIHLPLNLLPQTMRRQRDITFSALQCPPHFISYCVTLTALKTSSSVALYFPETGIFEKATNYS